MLLNTFIDWYCITCPYFPALLYVVGFYCVFSMFSIDFNFDIITSLYPVYAYAVIIIIIPSVVRLYLKDIFVSVLILFDVWQAPTFIRSFCSISITNGLVLNTPPSDVSLRYIYSWWCWYFAALLEGVWFPCDSFFFFFLEYVLLLQSRVYIFKLILFSFSMTFAFISFSLLC